VVPPTLGAPSSVKRPLATTGTQRLHGYSCNPILNRFVLILLGTAGMAGCTPPRDPLGSTCGAEANGGEAGAPGVGGAAGAGEGEPGGEGFDPTQPRPPPSANHDVVVSDEFVADVEISVHDKVKTVLVVRWTQTKAAEEIWLEFSADGEPTQSSRPQAGAVGQHRDVVLGVPGSTDVAINLVSRTGQTATVSSVFQGRTEAVPSRMPVPEVLSFTPELASSERWLFGSVEDSEGGRPGHYYAGTFWLYIMDRQGRIVWYYADPASNATTSFQRRARDGEYIVLEKRCYSCSGYAESVVKMTLDHSYYEEVPVAGLSDSIDVTEDGSILFDADHQLKELDRDGNVRSIWSCRQHFGGRFHCYTNTINYSTEHDTVLMSYPYQGTVVEIDRKSGALVGQYGNAPGSYAFAPPLHEPPTAWHFGFQHFPNIAPEGTLMVSSHMPGCDWRARPVAHQHAFLEFAIDRSSRRLVEQWRYTEGPEWPAAKGMAVRLDSGNTLANYGTGGVIREITKDKRTAWHVKFDVAGGDDFYNKMVGHNELVDDLYALNGEQGVSDR
jgi:hypothetical protein